MSLNTLEAQWKMHIDAGQFSENYETVARSIQWYLDQAAEKFPQRNAVLFQNLKMNFKTLREKAEIMAAALRKEGLKTGEKVAVMLPNIPQTIVTVWAVLKAGGVLVMTNPLYMEKELTHHFDDSQAKYLVTLDLFWDKVLKLKEQLPISKYFVTTIADGLAFPLNLLYPIKAKRAGQFKKIEYKDNIYPYKSLFKSKERYSEEPQDPVNTLALLQYTGGTTGVSKAAMLTHGNISSHLQQLITLTKEDGKEEILSIAVMPFFHIFGLTGTVFFPAALSSPTIPVARYSPHDILELIKKFKPSLFLGAPSIYTSLMQQKDIANYDLTCIKLCIVGAAPFPVDSLKKFKDLTKASIVEGLGLTECSPCISANPIRGVQKDGSVGLPFPGTYIKIVDLEDGTKELATGEKGEIVVKGPQVMQGYWNREDETALVLRDGWFYTGDIAYKDEDGYIFIVDRKKDMAIIGGYNVYPREIDEVLHEHPKVLDAVSLFVPDKTRGEKIKAYIVTKPGETVSIPELVAFCKEKLANYKVPKVFEFRDELPKSLVGKVLRRVLKEEEEAKLR